MMSSALAAPIACATQLLELKEHKIFERSELFTNGLLSRASHATACTTRMVLISCVGRCANAVFLRRRRPIRDLSIQTPYSSRS